MKYYPLKQVCLLSVVFFVATALAAQTPQDLSRSLEWDSNADSVGVLYHYQIVRDTNSTSDKPLVDYWMYRAADGRIETIYDESRLKTGKAVWLDVWTYGNESWQFDQHVRIDLKGTGGISSTALFDMDANVLKTKYEIAKDQGTRLLSDWEEFNWHPTMWHRDLGVWLLNFLPHLKNDAAPFTICLNSWDHLILFKAKEVEMEKFNGIQCRVISLKAQGLLNNLLNKGRVWVSEDSGIPRVVRWEQRISLSWTLPKLSGSLVDVIDASTDDWEQLKASFME